MNGCLPDKDNTKEGTQNKCKAEKKYSQVMIQESCAASGGGYLPESKSLRGDVLYAFVCCK